MQRHLEEISRTVAIGAHAFVVTDNAGWHTTRAIDIPANLSLLFLPPYSPELNPQENIWQFLRQNYLSSRVFKTYDDIVEACCKAWNKLLAETGRITSIATRQWAYTGQ
jgi:transposase